MKEQVLSCPSCGKNYLSRFYDSRKTYTCKHCRNQLKPRPGSGPSPRPATDHEEVAADKVENPLYPPFEAYQGDEPYIFVSYSHKDSSTIYPEIENLYQKGYRIWYDEGIEPGNEWPEEIALALSACSHFIVFVSPAAAASENVRNEINFALNKGKPFLAVHIRETKLPPGLELRMGDRQALMKYRMRSAALRKKMTKAFDASLIDPSSRKERTESRRPERTEEREPQAPPPPRPKRDSGFEELARALYGDQPVQPARTKARWRPRVPWRPLAWAGGAAAALAFLVLALRAMTGGVAASADMVSVPEGEYWSGAYDESVTVQLMRKYLVDIDDGKASSSIVKLKRKKAWEPLQLLLGVAPRQATISPFLIDRDEVTNAQYKQFLAAPDLQQYRHPEAPKDKDHRPMSWSSQRMARLSDDNCPVTGVDWFDAYAFARWAGKRLPTPEEWEAAARGKQGWIYPWGNQYDRAQFVPPKAHGMKNGPLPFDFFQPSSPFGAAALGGNVAEWTAKTAGKEAEVRGASFPEAADIIAVTFFRRTYDRDTRGFNLGLRCAADIGASVKNLCPMVKVEGGAYAQGGEKSPLLDLLRRFTRGQVTNAINLITPPPRRERVKSFHIMRCEVSNAEYAKFLEHIRKTDDHSLCHADEPKGKNHTPKCWDDAKFNAPEQPVIGVDFYDAYAYARWAGMRLPTAQEWEKAARGADGRLYPWGQTFDASKCTSGLDKSDRPQPVDSKPGGKSPYGALNMTGNVCEWVDTPDPKREKYRLTVGADWQAECRIYGLTYFRRGARPDLRTEDLGFRCVRD